MQDSNLNCKQLEDALDAYHDLELDGEQAQSVEAHLAGCATCSARLADIERVVLQIKSLPEVNLTRDLSAVIEAKILSQAGKVSECSEESLVKSDPGESNLVALITPAQSATVKKKSKPHLYWLASAAAVLALCFSFGQFKPLAAPLQEARTAQREAILVADNQLPAVKAGKIEAVQTSSSKKVKPVLLVKKRTTTVTEKMLAETGKSSSGQFIQDRNRNHVNDKDELVAFYEYDTDNASDIGISTNEDGLYAIKL